MAQQAVQPAPAKHPVTDSWPYRLAVAVFWFLWDYIVTRFPRATTVAYAATWCLLDLPAWNGSWAWRNAFLVAVNPVTVAVAVRVWWEVTAPDDDPSPVVDGRVAMWNTVMASQHEGSNW